MTVIVITKCPHAVDLTERPCALCDRENPPVWPLAARLRIVQLELALCEEIARANEVRFIIKDHKKSVTALAWDKNLFSAIKRMRAVLDAGKI